MITRTLSRLRPSDFIAVGAAAFAVMAATLTPTVDQSSSTPLFCLICGDRGIADAVLNVILLMPLGFAIARAGAGLRLTLIICALFSLFIEVAQFRFIVGRDASVADILYNTTGGIAGALLYRNAGLLLRPGDRAARMLAALWIALALLISASPAVFSAPSIPSGTYYGQWTPDLGDLRPYGGQLINAEVGGISVPGTFIGTSPILQRALQERASVFVRFTVEEPHSGLAPLFAIADQDERELIMIAIEHSDVIVRWRTRSIDLKLDRPMFRFEHALAGLNQADTVDLIARSFTDRVELHVGAARYVHRYSSSDGWTLLWFVDGLTNRMYKLFSAIWIVCLAIPIGMWWALQRERVIFPILFGAVMMTAPLLVGLAPPTPFQIIAGALALLLAAWLAARVLARKVARSIS